MEQEGKNGPDNDGANNRSLRDINEYHRERKLTTDIRKAVTRAMEDPRGLNDENYTDSELVYLLNSFQNLAVSKIKEKIRERYDNK